MACRWLVMFLTQVCQCWLLSPLAPPADIQMYCDPPTAQIAHPQDAADDVSSQAVKHKNLPYGLPICVQDWRRPGDYSIQGSRLECGFVVRLGGYMVEIQYALDRGFPLSAGAALQAHRGDTDLLGGHEGNGR